MALNSLDVDINLMKSLNMIPIESLETIRGQYIEKFKALNPELPEDSVTMNDLWGEYARQLKKHPRIPVDESFPSYETWRQEISDNQVIHYCNEHYAEDYFKNKYEEKYPANEIEYEKFLSEEVENQARYIYHNLSFLYHMKSNYNLSPENDKENPYRSANEVMLLWTDKIFDYVKNMIPKDSNSNNQTITFVTGFPGSGKSYFIEGPDSSDELPIRNTKLGLLIDSDEYQKYIPGYSAGAGSERTLAYAISRIKPKLFNYAVEMGNDVVVPLVGGSAEILTNEVLNAISLNPGAKVKILLVPEKMNASFQRTLSRASLPGNRFIAPTTKGDPEGAFQSMQAWLSNPDIDNPLDKKIVSKFGIKKNKDNPSEAAEAIKAIKYKLANQIDFEILYK